MSSPAPATLEAASSVSTAEKQSYRQILKSSALIGGSQAANIAIGIIRTKVMAVLLGPAGVGLIGMYGSIADLTQSLAGMGVNSSGVRQIAEAAGSNDTERIAFTGAVLRRVSLVLGLIGALLLLAFSRQISIFTFGSDKPAPAVSLLSLAVFFRLVSASQGALLNGMRRIADLAKMNVLGALFGTIISIVIVYFMREDGIVPSLVGVAAMTILTSWWYSRKIQLEAPRLELSKIGNEAIALLKLGVAFMASGFLTMGAAYVVRMIILRKLGVDSAGFYQSAWTLGGLYIGFILQAMGADFYPRLTAVANDNIACNRLVNEQAAIGLLLSGPGVIATLTVAPLIIKLFYSAKFYAAVDVLRWICLGATLRVITWPLGYIVLAKGRQNLFFGTDLAWTVANVSLTLICVNSFGLAGAGMAFFGSYIFHGCFIYPVMRRVSGFRWSAANRKSAIILFSLIAAVFIGCYSLPLVWSACLGVVAACVSGFYSFRTLAELTSFRPPQPLRAAWAGLRGGRSA